MPTLNTLSLWFLVFVTYSFVGWLMEVAHSIVCHKKFTNRGFLIGPLCPVYGFGTIIMTLLLGHVTNIMTIFIVAMVASTILEYTTSFVMEKLFHVRWWDYSHEPLNLNGRVSIRNSTMFGLMGVLVIKFANPIVFGFYNMMPAQIRLFVATIIMIVFLVDLAVSLWLIIGCRVTVGTVNADATEEITAHIRAVLMGKGKLSRRLAKAFPNMTAKHKTTRKKSSRRSAAKKAVKAPSER